MREQRMIWVKYIGRKPFVSQSYDHVKYNFNKETKHGMVELIPEKLLAQLIVEFPGEYISVSDPTLEKRLNEALEKVKELEAQLNDKLRSKSEKKYKKDY